MKKIELEIKALSPLAIGQKKPGGNISKVEDFIPGSVIRGAIASEILKQSGQEIEPDDDFHKLFLSESQAIFQNAYPGNAKNVGVLPTTALSSKRKSGFKSEDGDNGVFDTLIDRFCAESHDQIYDPNCPTEKTTYGERVDNFSGFYTEISNEYSSTSTTNRLLTRVGINRRRATSEERVLYSIQVLNESKQRKKEFAIYKSAILASDDSANSLQTFIENHKNIFRLGGASSRGLGKVQITTKPPIDIKSNLDNRINKFNQKLRTRWNEWGKIFGKISEIPNSRVYFTIDLQADAILNENWQRTTVISKAMLQQFTGVNDLSLELHAAYSSYDYRSGWNAAWGLMKDVELVTNRGSVYLFSTDNKDLWLKAWEDLEIYGIGERTSEGFGQVQICNEFHNVLREEAV